MILQSPWCLEVHSNSWLSDLKVGKATKILQEEHRIHVTDVTGWVTDFTLKPASHMQLFWLDNRATMSATTVLAHSIIFIQVVAVCFFGFFFSLCSDAMVNIHVKICFRLTSSYMTRTSRFRVVAASGGFLTYQHLEHFLRVWVHLDQLLVQSRNLQDEINQQMSFFLCLLWAQPFRY